MESKKLVSDAIRYAELNGIYVLRFEGDIRVTVCASLDEFITNMFSNPQLSHILLDLSEAKNIDSTALGMIAKIAAKSRKHLQESPLTLTTNPDVGRILECMGLPQVLNIVQNLELEGETFKSFGSYSEQLRDMPLGDHTQEHMCEKVLEAHKALMSLNENNKVIFHDLVSNLEEERADYSSDTTKH